ncbi:MAG TPA: RHS repeat-associated core domain-containing protein, partial [Kiritimatiellia bacterium]|nr:RHS repeat-associated core domain-containing protein [Kiritimatiellia bacterium]
GFTNHPNVVTAMTQVVVGQAAYTHDPNGNLTADANFLYRYDALNQLTNVVTKLGATNLLANRYDGLGRRVQATIGGTNIVRYVYLPGTFLVLATLDGANNLLETFTHGPDLSGTLGGAGGIGGILSQTKHQGQSTTHFLHPDSMGNVVMTADESGAVSSSYRYTPFGRHYAKTGPFISRFTFSSKEFDPVTGLGYWGYRFYSPGLGRWVNRDPIGERGGVNLFNYVYNRACNSHDSLGLCWSNARALAHYLNPLAKRRVSLGETGCLANVSHGLISKFDEIWSLIHGVAIQEVSNKKCGELAKRWSKFGTTRDSAQTSVFWIGGISLAVKYNCEFMTNSRDCTVSYECRTEISMDDAFEHPLDFNGRVRVPLPGHGGPDVAIAWPDPKVDFGFVYNVYHTWHDEIRNTLKCK